MNEFLKLTAQYIAMAAESIAVIFIITGILGSLFNFIRKTLKYRHGYRAMTESRMYLGHSLSIALEFLIGADILRTAIAPTWEDIGKLGAIVGIRTVLNFFLSKELKEMEAQAKTV